MEKKKEKQNITIVTHSGKFHPDDIFAVATLSLLLEDENEIQVVRSRDPEIIHAADYVVDVGGIYDEEKKRFDHHQEGRAGSRANGIPYSSFGLVWKTYGEGITGSSEIMTEIDNKLVACVDAHDNGLYPPQPMVEDVYMYTIGDFFSSYKMISKDENSVLDTNFLVCVDIAKNLLKREIRIIKDKKEVEQKVESQYLNSKDKTLIILDKHYPGHKEYLSMYREVLLTISPDSVNNTWVIQTMRDNSKTFESRIYFPRSWAGKRDEELEKVTGVSGSVFCHNDCFIAVAQTKEGAIKLAELALKEAGQ